MNRRVLAVLAVWVWASAGCAAAIGPSISHDEREQFRAATFDFARLKSGGLAVLGVTSTIAPEGIREDVAFLIDQTVTNRLSKVRLVSRGEALARARQAGMAGDLQRLIQGRETGGAIDAGLLRRIAALEGVRYFLTTSIVEYERITRDVPPPTSITAAPGPSQRSRAAERVQRVRLRSEIWDARCGDVVWVGEGGTEAVEDAAAENVRLQDVVSMAAANVISILPRPGEERGASEKECGG